MELEQVRKIDVWKKVCCAFFAVLLIFNGVLMVMQLLTNTKLERHNKILLTLPPNLQEEIAGTFKQTATDIESETLKTAKDTAAKIVADASAKNNADEVASNMARDAAESGDLQLAKIYALNAISHRPDKVDYLKFYVDMAVNDSTATSGELNQILAMLDSSLYNVPAGDVNKILKLREQVSQRKKQIDTQVAVPAINLNEELKSLASGQYSLKNIINEDSIDANKLQKRIERINALLDEEELTDEWRTKLNKDLQASSNIYAAYITIKSVTNALDKAESHANKSSLTDEQILSARNQLSTATTLLAQIWTLELPSSIVDKAEAIQEKISVIDEKLNVLASQGAMKKHDGLAKKLKFIEIDIKNKEAADYVKETVERRANKNYNETGTLTKYLQEIQECVTELQTLKIFDKKGREKAISTLKTAQALALKVSAKRYQAYQVWAVKKIETVLNRLDDKNFFQAYTNAQAIEDFRNYLMDIDRGLLTYDVGTCYDKAFYLIFTDQVPTKKQADLQFEKATFEKMGKLEDF